MNSRAPIILLILALGFGCEVAMAQQTLVVDQAGSTRTLGEALEQAGAGDRIVVRAGVYAEGPLVVERPVEIRGEAGAVLDGESNHQILKITADSVTIRGLTFRNIGTSFVEDRAAVKVDGARHCVIENNRFENAFFGIYLARTEDCRITGNTIVGGQTRQALAGNGIHLWYSKNIRIEGNRVSGHRDGIYLEFVEDSDVSGNLSDGNLRYGLHFMFSDRCAYRDNILRKNSAGVAVMYTKNVEMTGNRFEDNWGSAAFGLLLKDITDSRVANNHFIKNTVGLYAEGSNRVKVEDNEFVGNGWAVKIMANADANLFTGNSFIGNTFDVATNSRQSYSTFRENYWDAYRGYDLDRDGYGDVPFRPVRLFALIVERNAPALMLLRSFFVDVLDAAERVLPALTPETLVDDRPLMRRPTPNISSAL